MVGGPLDGLLLDITDRTPNKVDIGIALATELEQSGADGPAMYDPRLAAPVRWDWGGDSP